MYKTLQWQVLPLIDNLDDDKFSYELHVYTGFHNKGITKSNISLVIAGTEGDTGVRPLKDGVRQVCEYYKQSYQI